MCVCTHAVAARVYVHALLLAKSNLAVTGADLVESEREIEIEIHRGRDRQTETESETEAETEASGGL